MSAKAIAEIEPTISRPSAQSAELAALRGELEQHKLWARRIAEVCEEAARGNLEVRILGCNVGGDIQRMTNAINHSLDLTDAFVREAGAALDYAARGKFFRKVTLRGLLGSFRHGAKLINNASEEMARKDSAIAAEKRKKQLADEFETSVHKVVETLAASAESLRKTAQTLTETAQQTARQASVVAGASKKTSSNIETVAAAAEELSSTASEIENQVRRASEIAQNAVHQADRTHEIVSGLAAAQGKIGGVVKLISSIASQTNLLALNATIEAARAGEAGKGFAVVASEVKTLAQETARATENIQAELKSVQTASDKTVQAIDDIVRIIREMDDSSRVIRNSMDQQKDATRDISSNVQQAAEAVHDTAKNVEGVNDATRQTTDMMAGILQAASGLSEQTEKLRGSVAEFLGKIRA